MKKSNRAASLLTLLTTMVCTGAPALAQDFLTSQTAQAPSFLNNAASSGGATGAMNNASNLLTGPGAYNAGVVSGRSLSLPQAGFANMAQNSVNMTSIPSGQFNYGFTTSPPVYPIIPGLTGNNFGNYANQALPVVSSGSVDINTVDCPYLRASYGISGAPIINPWTVNLNVFGTNTPINFQETADAADLFLNAIGL